MVSFNININILTCHAYPNVIEIFFFQASTAFLGDSQPAGRKGLAMYPIFLFYFVVSWLVISHTASWIIFWFTFNQYLFLKSICSRGSSQWCESNSVCPKCNHLCCLLFYWLHCETKFLLVILSLYLYFILRWLIFQVVKGSDFSWWRLFFNLSTFHFYLLQALLSFYNYWLCQYVSFNVFLLLYFW